MDRKILLAALLASAGGLASSLANAVPIQPSPTITIGGITFDDFTCSITGGFGLTCPDISVTSSVSTKPPDAIAGEDGISIQGAFNGFPGTEDVIITYDATLSGGSFSDAEVYFNGTPVSTVSEDVFNNANGHEIGTLDVFSVPPETVFTDAINLTEPATSIYVVKDIGLAFGPYNGGFLDGTISIINQNFSTVPEPATLALFGTGLLSGAWFLRRRRTLRS